MNMSERTLRRRLLAAGFRYQVLVDSVRKARSLELLSHSRLPVAAVAQEMGFADVRSFRRAFRRWMGVAPTEIRERSEG
jgi:AraC-like DNA-binding protein